MNKVPTHKSLLPALFVVAAAATLVGCGGGGSAADQSVLQPVPSPAPTPAPPPPAPAPAPAYEIGTPQRAVFDELNAERTRCGFGVLARNAKLDTAAQGQADYETARWNDGTGYQYVTSNYHRQVSGLSYFTGAAINDRLVAAGYSMADGGEVGNRKPLVQLPAADPERAVELHRGLMATVYHMAGLLGPVLEVGIGYGVATTAPTTLTNYPMATLVGVVGRQSGTTRPPQLEQVLAWPCTGSTVNAVWDSGEWPNPMVNTGWTLPYGPPLYFRSPVGTTLNVASFTLSGYSSGTYLLTASNDPQAQLKANQAFLLLQSPLSIGASYTVTVSGTVDAVAFTRSYTFTTR